MVTTLKEFYPRAHDIHIYIITQKVFYLTLMGPQSHIYSEKDIFNDKIETKISNGVATIGKKYVVPKGIGAVSWF